MSEQTNVKMIKKEIKAFNAKDWDAYLDFMDRKLAANP